jgi:diacylglycerol kinase (ATP)
MREAAIVFNPIAGSGRGDAVSARAESQLREAGWRVRRIPTRERGGAATIASEIAREIDLLVVAGGDGSLREAIEGLGEERRRVEIGLLPIGNANVVARELEIPLEPEGALRVLLEGSSQAMDLAIARSPELGTRLFLAMVGIGWDARTVHLLDGLRHTRLGRIWYRLWADSAYVLTGLLAALQLRPPGLQLRADGRGLAPRYRALQLCNLRTYGKGMAMAPDAHPASALLHYQARKRAFLPLIAWQLIAAQLGRRAPRFISDYGSATRLAVSSDQAFQAQIDGDYWGRIDQLEVEILPAAVRIITPTPATAQASRTPPALQ